MSVPRPVPGNLHAAGNGFSYRTPADAILNTNGIFYHASIVGEYISNTLAGQLAQIFHEEAHLTIGLGGMPLIPNDGFSALVSRMNTASVLGHCRAAINGAVATAGPAPGSHLAP